MNGSLAQQQTKEVPTAPTQGKLRFIGAIDVPMVESFFPHKELVPEMGFRLQGKSLRKHFLRPRRSGEPISPVKCEVRGFHGSVIRPSEFLPRLLRHAPMRIGQLWFVLNHLERPIPGYGACLLCGLGGERLLVSTLLHKHKGWEIEEITYTQRELTHPANQWHLIRPAGSIFS